MKIYFYYVILTLISAILDGIFLQVMCLEVLLTLLMDWFLYDRDLHYERVKDPTCFKNLENPPCIDLILTSNPYNFQISWVISVCSSKNKYIRGNNIPLFNKSLVCAHKTRKRYRNGYYIKRFKRNETLYVKQRNYFVSLLRKSKKKHTLRYFKPWRY